MGSLHRHFTYSNVMATIAVFVALGGASYAATQLPKKSVGTKQIKNNAVTTAKIKDGAVTQSKLATGALGTATTGQVSQAEHANSADSAVHANDATRANDAGTLGGLPPSAFAPASSVVSGVASTSGKNVILTVPDAFRMETMASNMQKVIVNVIASSGSWIIASHEGFSGSNAPFVHTVELASPVESIIVRSASDGLVYSVQCAQAPSAEMACVAAGG
jgi:hypothetical protein